MFNREFNGTIKRLEGAGIFAPAETAAEIGAVITASIGSVDNLRCSQGRAGEVFAVIVQRKGFVPWTGAVQ